MDDEARRASLAFPESGIFTTARSVPGLPQLMCTFSPLKNRGVRYYVPTLACGRSGTENPLYR
jgi:hypothetical protein